MGYSESSICILEAKMEALICLSVFIVVSSIWAFLSNKKRAARSRNDAYYVDYDQGYDNGSE